VLLHEREQARAALFELAARFTDPCASSSTPATHRYTLRGVATITWSGTNTTYTCYPPASAYDDAVLIPELQDSEEPLQWWKLSYNPNALSSYIVSKEVRLSNLVSVPQTLVTRC